MPIVTSIDRWRGKRRADVVLSDGSSFSLSFDILAARGLVTGTDITPEERRWLVAEDQRQAATEAALRLLALHPRSEKDLRSRLKRRGWDEAAVQAAATRMHELGYLDDEAYARFYVEARQNGMPRSRRYVLYELQRQGIDRETALAAVNDVSDVDAALVAAQRRLRVLAGLDYPTFQRRLGAFLSGRGFSYGVARQVIERCWRELQGEDVP